MRIRVEHRTLGSLFGTQVGRQGRSLLLRLDLFEGVQRVHQRFVSDAEGDARDEYGRGGAQQSAV